MSYLESFFEIVGFVVTLGVGCLLIALASGSVKVSVDHKSPDKEETSDGSR